MKYFIFNALYTFQVSTFNDHHGLLTTPETWSICVFFYYSCLSLFIRMDNWKYTAVRIGSMIIHINPYIKFPI
jgi:hypothetical protein